MSPSIGYSLLRDWFGLLAHRAAPGEHPFDGPGKVLAELADGSSRGVVDLVYGARWVLEDLTADAPLLLTVDDLQWADSGSIQALDLLAPALSQLPCMLVYAVRTGEAVDRPEELARIQQLSRVLTPSPLTERAVAELLSEQGLDEALAPRLHRATGGVPLFVTEVIASGGEEIPESLVGAITARLKRLSPTSLTTAHGITVLGDQATLGAISELTGCAPSSVADDISLLTAAHLVGAEDGHYSPRHPLIGEAVLAGISAVDTAALHSRAAEVLRDRGAPRTVVAGHLLRTAPGTDPDVRLRLAEQGRHALATGAHDRARAYLERALAEGPVGPDEIPVLAALGSALTGLGEVDAALACWDRAAGMATDADALAQLRSQAGDALVVSGRYEQAKAAFGDLLDATPATSVHGQRLRARMVMAGLLTGAPAAEMHQQLDRVTGHPVRPASDEDPLTLAVSSLVHVFEVDSATLARELAQHAQPDGGPIASAASLDLSALTLIWTSSLSEADEVLTRAMDEARTRSSVHDFASAAAMRGMCRTRMGMINEALSDLEAARAQRVHGWNASPALVLGGLVECRIARGELDMALGLREELEPLAHSRGMTGALASSSLADLAEANGDHEAAARLYAEVGRLVADRMDNPAVVPWRSGRALALIRLGQGAEAAQLARENAAKAESFGAAYAWAQALRTLAAVDPTCNRTALLRKALGLLSGVPATRLKAQIATDLAGMLVLLEGGTSTTEVIGLLRRAEECALTQELRPLGERVQRLLARIGEPARRPASESAALLTPSERRVADLAASGLTNREIAQRLFVTVKAVEWHLSNVYRKLGIRSRTRLPAVLTQRPG